MNGRGIAQAPGTVIGAKYRLESPLARGGMGSVWVARHVQLKVAVAVKFMAPSFAASPAARARFEREAMAAANLRSPHIVDVRDYGVEGDIPYLVMELLRGEDLGAKLQRERRLSLPVTAALLAQVAKALRRAHEEGLIHRDLKPANIFLARDDDEEEMVKVLDFGIAKDTGISAGADVTGTGEMIGSPHYMSPEQIRSEKDLDFRSDLWSLGVIVFRALTGHLPFPGEVIGAVLGKVLADPIPLATQVAPDLPPALDRFFARCLVRDRSQRFSSVREMADDLTAISGGPRAPQPSLASSGAFVAMPAISAVVPAEDQTQTLMRPMPALPARGPAPVAPVVAPPVLSPAPPLPPPLGSAGTSPLPAQAPHADALTHAVQEIASISSPVALTGGGGASRTVSTSARTPVAWIAAGLSFAVLMGSVAFFVITRSRAQETSPSARPLPTAAIAESSIQVEQRRAPSPPEPTEAAAPTPISPPSGVPVVIPAPPTVSTPPPNPVVVATAAVAKPGAAPRATAAPAVAAKPPSPKPATPPKGLVDTGL